MFIIVRCQTIEVFGSSKYIFFYFVEVSYYKMPTLGEPENQIQPHRSITSI